MHDVLRRCLVIGAVGASLCAAHPGAAQAAAPATSPTPTPTATVTPLPAPGRPVVSELTATGATLTWTPSGPVFRYSLQYLVNGEWRPYDATNRPVAQLARLTPDTEYTFRVWAAALVGSGYGTSPPSEPVTFRTPPAGEPTPPTAPTGTLTCRLEVTGWTEGFLVVGALANPGSVAVTGWTLTVTLPAQARVTGGWNADRSANGAVVTFTPTTWTRTVAPGATTTFGLYGLQAGGLDALIADLDGTPCQIVRRAAGP
ncbi:MAG TPA: cellulose binding domain-containing protein [Micromonosporaceae bacterium]|nr:cellulose binding domain-containing protein [Micromonosporaceae bacterium]